MESTKQLFADTTVAHEALLGELRGLLAQLGAAESLVNLSAAADALAQPELPSWEVFGEFISTYKTKVLYQHELSAIYRAYLHGRSHESRELVSLDQQLENVRTLRPFSQASRRIGETQLKALAALRGERVAAKYYAAVQEGRANGWHTLVYGLTLAVYSIPVRQGLVGYATQILRAYIHAAARTFGASTQSAQHLLDKLCADLPQEVDSVLTPRA
jgi:urease accessory protein UreF